MSVERKVVSIGGGHGWTPSQMLDSARLISDEFDSAFLVYRTREGRVAYDASSIDLGDLALSIQCLQTHLADLIRFQSGDYEFDDE